MAVRSGGTVLYTTIGVAGWLVWRRRGLGEARIAFALYAAQLVLNAAWTWLFFAGNRFGLAFGEIVVLLLTIAATIVAFWRVRSVAGAPLLPYLAWAGFATALNLAIRQLDR